MHHRHYHIQQHLHTIQSLRNRTHDGGFRGIERRMMMIILSLKLLFPGFWIRHYADMQWHRIRNRYMEYYIITKNLITVSVLFLGLWTHVIRVVIVAYLLLDLMVYLLWLVVLWDLHHHKPDMRRNLILLGINILELVSAFAIFYLASGTIIYSGTETIVQNWLDAFYFSLVTFSTVWYWDINIINSLWRGINIIHILTNFLFISLIISSVVSKIEIKSES
jgi:hypothetical protein